MRVTEFTAYHVCIPLKKRIQHASHTRTSTDSLIVCCQLDSGHTGWGEGLPRIYVTGETIETAFAQLEQTNWPEALGESFQNLSEAIIIADSFHPAPLSHGNTDRRDCFGNTVKSAVELAFLDAVTRAYNVRFSTIVDHVAEIRPIRQRVDRVQYSTALTGMSPWQQRIAALKYRLYGFGQCKVKVGVEGVDDASLLQRVRKILGSQFDIRLDANEAWQPEEVIEKMTPLLPFNITALEQPVPHAEVAGLAALRTELPVPIMLDESLCSISDAERAIAEQTCDLFNIRISKCGGFLNSLKLAALAHQAGLGYQLGCQVGETGILSAAGRHFATSIAGIRYLEGSYDRHLVKERLAVEDLTFGYGGWATALEQPGLGITIDEQALKRVTIKQSRFSLQKVA